MKGPIRDSLPATAFWSFELEAPAAIFWSSVGFSAATLIGSEVAYHYAIFSDDPALPLSALLVSVISALVAATVRLSGKRFIQVLLWGMALLPLVLGIVNLVSSEIQPFQKEAPLWAQILNLSLERNLPTLYTSYLLGLVGVMALVCCASESAPVWTLSYRDHFLWVPVALGFFFLALDETVMIHEQLNRALRERMDIAILRGNYWTAVYVPCALAALGFFGRFFYQRFVGNEKEWILLVAGIVLWMCVPILEVGGVTVFRAQHLYKLASTVEEMFEMWGSVAFLSAFVLYATRRSSLNQDPTRNRVRT